jgi:putative CocE/NonD family hydrolase
VNFPGETRRFAPLGDDGDVVVARDVMVAMRDGVRLAADVYRPARDGGVDGTPLPVLVERTPYGKHLASRSEIDVGMSAPRPRSEVAREFARAGYAVVIQDCRGRHASEGEFTKYLAEAADGYDTMAWIVGEPWCNGRIGTFGLSYAAHTQMAAACLSPPGLKCMVLDSGGFSSAYRCGIRQGGAFELKQATWAYRQAKESRAAQADPAIVAALDAEDIRLWFTAMPWSEGRSPVRALPEYEHYLLEQWRHGTFDDYWKQLGLYAEGYYDTLADIPVMLMSSWYDAYVHTTFDNYAGLRRRASRPVEVIMGPWTHGNRNETVFGDVEFGAAATFDGNVAASWIAHRRRWFDRWLKDAPAPRHGPRVRLFLMGGGSGTRTSRGKVDHGGRWIGADDWPLPGTEWRSLYLEPSGRLDDAAPVAPRASLAYDFDPRDPVPTIGGALTSGEPIFEGGAYDQREDPRFFGCTRAGLPLTARRDVLSFETAPLAHDVAVVGPVRVELFVSSSAPDTDFTAKLVDVHPPTRDDPAGFAMNVTDGIFRCRYRSGWSTPSPVVPGEVFAITIEPFATANLFKAGHRIRLDVASSNFPKYDVNPNTGGPEGVGRTFDVARNTVHMEASHPSRIVLPVVDASALKPF